MTNFYHVITIDSKIRYSIAIRKRSELDWQIANFDAMSARQVVLYQTTKKELYEEILYQIKIPPPKRWVGLFEILVWRYWRSWFWFFQPRLYFSTSVYFYFRLTLLNISIEQWAYFLNLLVDTRCPFPNHLFFKMLQRVFLCLIEVPDHLLTG